MIKRVKTDFKELETLVRFCSYFRDVGAGEEVRMRPSQPGAGVPYTGHPTNPHPVGIHWFPDIKRSLVPSLFRTQMSSGPEQ